MHCYYSKGAHTDALALLLLLVTLALWTPRAASVNLQLSSPEPAFPETWNFKALEKVRRGPPHGAFKSSPNEAPEITFPRLPGDLKF